MKIINTEQLGAAARARRKHLKVTQKELAMTCGTGLRFIVDLEKGKRTCQIGKTLQVLQALGLAIETGNTVTIMTTLGWNSVLDPHPFSGSL